VRKLPGEEWTLHQEGTVGSNDGLHRWMGSISINGKGDIGLGYSIAGENQFASLQYVGRREADALGEMTFDGYQFADGLSTITVSNRFGDYSKMSTDPIDDSFWFCAEYAIENGDYGSKIVNFNLRRDTFDISPRSLVAPVDSDDLGVDEVVQVEIRNQGVLPADNISVGYIFENGVEVFDKDLNNRNDTIDVSVEKLAQWDASLRDITGLDFTICGTMQNVNVTLNNLGTETLTDALIISSTNNTGPDTLNWSGQIASGESEIITIGLNNLSNGPDNFTVYVALPNGQDDQYPDDNSTNQDFMVQLGGIGITIEILTDNFPTETTWSLFDNVGMEVASGGPYDNATNWRL